MKMTQVKQQLHFDKVFEKILQEDDILVILHGYQPWVTRDELLPMIEKELTKTNPMDFFVWQRLMRKKDQMEKFIIKQTLAKLGRGRKQ